jgi:hypothetical protein
VRSRITATVIGAAILIGGYAAVQGGGDATANIWVDANGGTCADNASLVAYDDAAACGTLDAANDTCDNGDVVRVASGATIGSSSTGTTTIDGGNSRSSACIVRAATDAGDISVTGTLALTGAWLTAYNLTWTNQTSDAVDDYAQPHVSGTNLALYGLDSSSIQITAPGDNILIEDFDIGPCHAEKANPICTPRLHNGVGPSNVTLRNGSFHNQSSDDTPGACGSDTCHTVGLALFNTTDVLLDGVHFYDNKTTNIRIQDRPDGENNGVTIQNSWFEPGWTNSANPSGDDTSTVVYSGNRLTPIDVDDPVPGLLVQFNTFGHMDDCPDATGCGLGVNANGASMGLVGDPAIVRGNLISGISSGSCSESSTTVTYDQNVLWPHSSVNGPTSATGSCNSTNTFKAYNFNIPVVTNHPWTSPDTGGLGAHNFHITGAAWSGDSKVTSNCIALDKDGDARSSTCDAGSDER